MDVIRGEGYTNKQITDLIAINKEIKFFNEILKL